MWMRETLTCHKTYLMAHSVGNLEAQICDGNVHNYEVSDVKKDTVANWGKGAILIQMTTHTCKIIRNILYHLLSGMLWRAFMRRSVRLKLCSDYH